MCFTSPFSFSINHVDLPKKKTLHKISNLRELAESLFCHREERKRRGDLFKYQCLEMFAQLPKNNNYVIPANTLKGTSAGIQQY